MHEHAHRHDDEQHPHTHDPMPAGSPSRLHAREAQRRSRPQVADVHHTRQH